LSTSYGQDTLTPCKFSIDVAPLNFIDLYTCPAYQVGIECKIFKAFSIHLQGGQYFRIQHQWGSRLNNLSGYLIKCELKYYLNRPQLSRGSYIALEAIYKTQNYDWQDSIHLTPAYLTTYQVTKYISAFNLKIGDLIAFKSGIILDFYAGLGLRYRKLNTSLTTQEVNALKYSDDSNYDGNEAGGMGAPANYWNPNIVLGFRIGYILK